MVDGTGHNPLRLQLEPQGDFTLNTVQNRHEQIVDFGGRSVKVWVSVKEGEESNDTQARLNTVIEKTKAIAEEFEFGTDITEVKFQSDSKVEMTYIGERGNELVQLGLASKDDHGSVLGKHDFSNLSFQNFPSDNDTGSRLIRVLNNIRQIATLVTNQTRESFVSTLGNADLQSANPLREGPVLHSMYADVGSPTNESNVSAPPLTERRGKENEVVVGDPYHSSSSITHMFLGSVSQYGGAEFINSTVNDDSYYEELHLSQREGKTTEISMPFTVSTSLTELADSGWGYPAHNIAAFLPPPPASIRPAAGLPLGVYQSLPNSLDTVGARPAAGLPLRVYQSLPNNLETSGALLSSTTYVSIPETSLSQESYDSHMSWMSEMGVKTGTLDASIFY